MMDDKDNNYSDEELKERISISWYYSKSVAKTCMLSVYAEAHMCLICHLG